MINDVTIHDVSLVSMYKKLYELYVKLNETTVKHRINLIDYKEMNQYFLSHEREDIHAVCTFMPEDLKKMIMAARFSDAYIERRKTDPSVWKDVPDEILLLLDVIADVKENVCRFVPYGARLFYEDGGYTRSAHHLKYPSFKSPYYVLSHPTIDIHEAAEVYEFAIRQRIAFLLSNGAINSDTNIFEWYLLAALAVVNRFGVEREQVEKTISREQIVDVLRFINALDTNTIEHIAEVIQGPAPVTLTREGVRDSFLRIYLGHTDELDVLRKIILTDNEQFRNQTLLLFLHMLARYDVHALRLGKEKDVLDQLTLYVTDKSYALHDMSMNIINTIGYVVEADSQYANKALQKIITSDLSHHNDESELKAQAIVWLKYAAESGNEDAFHQFRQLLVKKHTSFDVHLRHKVIQAVVSVAQRNNPLAHRLLIGEEQDSQLIDQIKSLNPVLLKSLQNILEQKQRSALSANDADTKTPSISATLFTGRYSWLNIFAKIVFGLAIPIQEIIHMTLAYMAGLNYQASGKDLWSAVDIDYAYATPLEEKIIRLGGLFGNLLLGSVLVWIFGGIDLAVFFNGSSIVSLMYIVAISNIALFISDSFFSLILRRGDVWESIRNIRPAEQKQKVAQEGVQDFAPVEEERSEKLTLAGKVGLQQIEIAIKARLDQGAKHVVVAIDGASGTGKTTLAKHIKQNGIAGVPYYLIQRISRDEQPSSEPKEQNLFCLTKKFLIPGIKIYILEGNGIRDVSEMVRDFDEYVKPDIFALVTANKEIRKKRLTQKVRRRKYFGRERMSWTEIEERLNLAEPSEFNADGTKRYMSVIHNPYRGEYGPRKERASITEVITKELSTLSPEECTTRHVGVIENYCNYRPVII